MKGCKIPLRSAPFRPIPEWVSTSEIETWAIRMASIAEWAGEWTDQWTDEWMDGWLTLSGRIGRNVIGARSGAADAVGGARRVRQQRLAEGRKGALELAGERRQVVDHQRQLQPFKSIKLSKLESNKKRTI